NINHSDIMEMEIPIVPTDAQEKMVTKYNIEFELYKKTVSEAEKRWTNIKNDLYTELIEGGH
ncbi:MAG: restriction endonuclease subunit M/S, partial [Clostridiales bacterium]|nr:restriction endonuclease subunit M/S [Clostridiales bacterium]